MVDDLFALALDRSPESVSIYGLDGSVLYMNPVTERIMGVRFADLKGKRLFEMYPDAIETAFGKAFHEAAAGGRPADFTHYYPGFDGWYANHVERVGERVHVYARDVTAEVRRERRIDTVARISTMLTRTDLDMRATAFAAAEIVAEVFAADCTIAMLTDNGETLEAIARASNDAAVLELLATVDRWPARLGNTGDALRTRKPVLSTREQVTGQDDARVHGVLSQYRPTSVVVAPLLLDDVVIGVINATRRAAPAFSEDDRYLLGQIAPSIALYVSNAARRAEANVLRSRLTTMADALPALAAFIDKEERYQYVNAGYERWFGGPRTRWIGSSLREMMGAGYSTIEPYVRGVLAGTPQRFRERIEYPSGTRHVDASYVPIRDDKGVIDGFAVLVNDISSEVRVAEIERDRRDAERHATTRLQNMLSLTARLASARGPEDLIRELVDGGRVAMDSLATTMWQLTPDGQGAQLMRASGTLTWQLTVGETLPLEDAGPVAACLRTGEAVWVVGAADRAARFPSLANKPPGARPVPDAIAVVPLSTDGVRMCLGFSFVDAQRLTADDRTYLEILASNGAEALRRANALEELRTSAETAQRARAEAESANRAKDEFLAMLGHELRNPLAPLVTALELMRMRGDDKLERERAVIGRQVQHLARLVDDLLDVSRITRGKIDLRRERLALVDVINKAVEQASPLLDERRHHLAVNVPSDLLIDGDATRLAQVFGNLLSNAAKYTPRGGRVQVTARPLPDDRVCVTVRDDGIGIPPSILPHVFDLFVQAPQSSERPAGGLGLGLTIVRSLVELHSGTVSVASDGPGRGTEFTVVLPAAMTPVVMAEGPTSTRDAKSAAALRILVVDDNEDAAMMLADMLDAYGHDIRTAFDGPSALRIADEFRPEVAVLDIGLPVMDGYELAQRLRATPELSAVRLIAVTGYGQESDRRRSLEAGFQAHLAKPVQIDQLVQLVERG